MAEPSSRFRQSNEALLQPLFVAAQQGDKKAYGYLLKQIGSIAEGYCRRKTGANEYTEDTVQDILLSVHRALHTYDPSRPCMPWLATLMYYRLQDALRVNYRNAKRQQAIFSDADIFFTDYVTDNDTDAEYLDVALNALPEKQRHVLHAMYKEDLSVKETGEKLGMSVSAVKVTAHRAYKTLRIILDNSKERA